MKPAVVVSFLGHFYDYMFGPVYMSLRTVLVFCTRKVCCVYMYIYIDVVKYNV